MARSWMRTVPFLILISLFAAACTTTGTRSGGIDAAGTINTDADDDTPYVDVNPYPASRRVPGSLEVNTFAFDETTAPQACVNDLRVYEAYLQVPERPIKPLDRTVNEYIREAGGAPQAIAALQIELGQLNTDLEAELDARNPFDPLSRARADDNIARIEDGILLNEALIEALNCHI